MSASRAVLDADIVFSRVLHELMGRLATGARLFDLVWSEELLDEVRAMGAAVEEIEAGRAWPEVSPVEAQATASMGTPSAIICLTTDTSTVIPRSLNDPVCELPHCLTHRSSTPSMRP